MYDIIIVGAGTAGCVLAERLTRSGKLRILLIEAGGAPESRFVSIPAGFSKLFKSKFDWAFESEPQASVGGRRIFTPRGKMLGGSSNMNAQIHQWCHPADFDGWVAAGADGWGWQDVAPVFRAQECWLGEMNGSDRGREGPMIISPNRNARALSHLFVEAARSAGLGRDAQYNGRAYRTGAWLVELAHKSGRRFSAYDAFLKPAMRRDNLDVITNSHVTKLVFEGGRAAGVGVRRNGTDQTLQCRSAVLAAGAFGSPQLLMLSGIGPANTLRELGIPVHLDVPAVGANLQDHPILPMVYRTHSRDTFKNAESPINALLYLLFKRGMLASSGVEGLAVAQIHPGQVSAPDLELLFLPLDGRNELLEPPQEHAFCLAPAVVAPRSRGKLFLRTKDPMAPPGIDFGLLSDPEGIDVSVLLAGVRLSRKIASTAPLLSQNAGELRPGASVVTEQDLLAYAGTTLQTVYHPVGTCRMGSDASAVADSRLRVRGVEGLWVADASVMPTVPRGQPNSVVAMIAERGGQWIESEVGR